MMWGVANANSDLWIEKESIYKSNQIFAQAWFFKTTSFLVMQNMNETDHDFSIPYSKLGYSCLTGRHH